MSDEFDLVAEFREDAGKGASRRLRRQGKVPAIIYGGGKPPRALAFDANTLLHKMENESFFSSVLTVKVGDKEQPSILKDVQMHPAKRQILHIDLQRIIATEKIRMVVPIHFANEETARGVKQSGGVVSHLLSEVEVTCLPKDLPEYLEVDLADMELDTMLHLSDIKLPAGVEIPELAQGAEHDHAIVSIHLPKAIKEPEEEEAEGEAGAAEEGEAAPAPEEKPSDGD